MMENESNASKIETLLQVVVQLKQYFEKLDAMAERQDAKIAELTCENRELKTMLGALVDKFGLLTLLVDSNQADIQVLKKYRQPGGIVQ